MTKPSAGHFSAHNPAWADVARLCRRISLLRERGPSDEAERLQATDLPALVAALREPSDTDETLAARMESIFALERERVADAAVLAELLAPLLSGSGGSSAFSAAAEQRRPDPSPQKISRPPQADIADFIDEMLAQERAPRRSHSSARGAA